MNTCRARTGRGFKHWTWGHAYQPSDLGQGMSWDITEHRLPTDIFMLT
jgi:hypothetical protein